MADIFILSSTEDTARVQPIRDAFLAQGRSVFLLNVPSKIGSEIPSELLNAGVVVVVWTHALVKSDVVHPNLLEPLRHKLLQIVLDDFSPDYPPRVFGLTQNTELLGWTGDTKDPAWLELNEAINAKLREPPSDRVYSDALRQRPRSDVQANAAPGQVREYVYPIPEPNPVSAVADRADPASTAAAGRSDPGAPVRKSPDAKKRPVDASVFCPRSFRAGESELIQVLVHLRGQRREASRTARAADEAARFTGIEKSLGELEPGDRISVGVDVTGARVEDSPEGQTWTGEILTFGFRVISDGQSRHVGICAVLCVNGAHVGRIAFRRRVKWRYSFGDLLAAFFPPRLSRFKRVFFSYARVDREQVKKTAREYEKFGISFFQDILHLDPGERWTRRLWKEIDRCDIFVLFWSSAAKASEWVLRETDRAWRRQARNGGLRPVLRPEILEHPVPAPDQDWLGKFHFDDPKYHKT